MIRNIKQRIFFLLDEENKAGLRGNRIVNLVIIVLIILSVIEVILESYQNIQSSFKKEIIWFEMIVVAVFTIEYICRLWTADLKYPDITSFRARFKFAKSTAGIIDLLAILPFYLPMVISMNLRYIRILRVMRLLRVFKLKRYVAALSGLRQAFITKGPQLLMTVAFCFILLIFSSALMYHFEQEAQADKFPNIPSAFYWAISTLTTVGYGDVVPVTVGGRVLAGVISVIGVAFVALPAGILGSGLMSRVDVENRASDHISVKAPRFCPHCGELLGSGDV
jgi:voltage-gated potassium channel